MKNTVIILSIILNVNITAQNTDKNIVNLGQLDLLHGQTLFVTV